MTRGGQLGDEISDIEIQALRQKLKELEEELRILKIENAELRAESIKNRLFDLASTIYCEGEA
jgi:regulator of replication initiation timing